MFQLLIKTRHITAFFKVLFTILIVKILGKNDNMTIDIKKSHYQVLYFKKF